MTKKKKYEKPLIKKVHGFDFVPKTGPGQICLLPRQKCPIKRKGISAKRKEEHTDE